MKNSFTKDEACAEKWFSVDSIADYVAQYTKDGQREKNVWEWYQWFRKNIRNRYPIKLEGGK